MHPLLLKLLNRRGIEDASKLDDTPLPDGSPSEKKMFENYQAVLSKEELTTKDIKEFCQSQVQVIEGKWRDLNLRQEAKAEWIPYHTVYKNLLSAIDSPRDARENLEKYLISLTK